MHIIIAPNAFKGSLSATEAADCIAEGFRQSRLSCRLTLFPIADGGDGTAALIVQKSGSELIKSRVHDPIGRNVEATFGWLENTKAAFIEMSETSGLRLLKKEELDPLNANTKGTGQLIRAALDKGAREIVLGVGGSATTDGGTGLLSDLGVRFLDRDQREIMNFPVGLVKLKSIDTANLDRRLKACKLTVLCDVKNTLLGEKGSATVFGPQKGANEEQVLLLEKCLRQFDKVVRRDLGVDMSAIIYGGAAGGVAAGLSAFLHAELVSGIDYFLNVMDFEVVINNADLIITAEGSLDAQTLEGKGPFGVAIKAREKNIPVVILAGAIPFETRDKVQKYFDAIFLIGNAAVSLQEAMENTAVNLKRTARELGNIFALKEK